MTSMVKMLSVSRSGYYEWLKTLASPSPRQLQRAQRDEQVRLAFGVAKKRNGARRLQVDLADQGYPCNVKTIGQSMARQGLVAKAARKFKITTDSNHQKSISPNLLGREFTADAPNQKWAGDITYLYTTEGWLYLAVVIDLYSRAVVGWSMSPRMTADLVCDAMNMALWRRGFPQGLIIHSDRGSQYCSRSYREIINEHKLRQSMSRKGNCWDNACVESFFHSLKVEAIHDEPLMDRETMRSTVFEYIDVDYNRQRRHSTLGYLSPEKFELKNVA